MPSGYQQMLSPSDCLHAAQRQIVTDLGDAAAGVTDDEDLEAVRLRRERAEGDTGSVSRPEISNRLRPVASTAART